jgi:DNA (cytosine-5)-methyltransferase 1
VVTPIPLGSICSGYGGLEMGISRVLPVVPRWVADYEPPKLNKRTGKLVEQKQPASLVLAHRFPGVPNLGDITIVRWLGTPRVKVLCGGTPCQDVSHAGPRHGMRAGTRSGIWSSMVDAIAVHRPTLVVWENVRGALSAGADSNLESCPICMGDERECNLRALGRVLGDLAELGYDAVWCGLRASDVGAAHPRFRVFVCAWPAENPDVAAGDQRWQPAPGQAAGGRARADAGRPDRAGADVPEPRHRGDTEWSRPTGRQVRERPPVRTEPRLDSDVDWGPFAPAVARWGRLLGRVAPAPTSLTSRGRQALSPGFVEWLMGLPAGHVTDVPGLSRDDMLHVLGNGVVPQQAEAAITWCLDRAPAWVRADLGLSP